jgi:hypothetical protein
MKMTLRQWQKTKKDVNDLIVQASMKNGSDGNVPYPIGFNFNYIYNHHKNIQIGKHNKTVLLSILNTDQKRRKKGFNRKQCIINLQKNNIKNKILDHHTYYKNLKQYKFIVSPEGNGIDCHRHYEALLSGSIPIVEKNRHIISKYKCCPILYTNDYSEITEDYLNKVYEYMIDKVFDFSPIFLSFYNENLQKQIKDNSNYWMVKYTGKVWYKI